MKLFCSFSFSGEDHEPTKNRMGLVVDTLDAMGHQAYCNLFDPVVEEMQNKNDIKSMFKRAFSVLTGSDTIIVIVASPDKSAGQLMEIGAAMSQGKPIFLLEHTSAQNSSFTPLIATKTIQWDNDATLVQALKSIAI